MLRETRQASQQDEHDHHTDHAPVADLGERAAKNRASETSSEAKRAGGLETESSPGLFVTTICCCLAIKFPLIG